MRDRTTTVAGDSRVPMVRRRMGKVSEVAGTLTTSTARDFLDFDVALARSLCSPEDPGP